MNPAIYLVNSQDAASCPALYTLINCLAAWKSRELTEECAWLQDVLYAGLQPQQALPQASEDKYVALVSGLSMGDEGGETASVALLVDYLAGLLGGPQEHEQVAKVMAR